MIGIEQVNRVCEIHGDTPSLRLADLQPLYATTDDALQGKIAAFVKDKGRNTSIDTIYVLAEHQTAFDQAINAALGCTISEYLATWCQSTRRRNPIQIRMAHAFQIRMVHAFEYTPKKKDLRIKYNSETIASASNKGGRFSDEHYRSYVDYYPLQFDQLVQLVVKTYEHWKHVHRIAAAVAFLDDLRSNRGIRRLDNPTLLDGVEKLIQLVAEEAEKEKCKSRINEPL